MTVSFKDFVKKYTDVPNAFVDDFFGLYDRKTTEKDFVIDFDVVRKWLGIQKHALRKTLVSTYIKNIDYKINRTITPRITGGNTRKDNILLTPHCFKMVCLSTKSKKGAEVREYFITIEATLAKYKDHIINSMENKIKVIEASRKPKVNPEQGIIYVFETPNKPGEMLYKLGRAKNLKKRLQSHQSGLAEDINTVFIFETPDIEAVEKCAKALLKKYNYRKYKEVYQTDIDLIKQIITECGTLIEKFITTPDKTTRSGGGLYMYITKL